MMNDPFVAVPPVPAAPQEPLPPAVAFSEAGEAYVEPAPVQVPVAASRGREDEAMDERMRILKMVEEGRVSATEGAQLLAALGSPTRSEAAEAPVTRAGGAKWLKVRVTDTYTGKCKVNVTVPLGLVNAALRLGGRFVPDQEREMVDEVSRALHEGLTGRIVDVYDDEDGERVEVYIE
jgi:hypothetical protein